MEELQLMSIFPNLEPHTLYQRIRIITDKKYIFHNYGSKPRVKLERIFRSEEKGMEIKDLNSAFKECTF